MGGARQRPVDRGRLCVGVSGAYRYYSLYIAQKVMKLDPTRRRLRLLTTTV